MKRNYVLVDLENVVPANLSLLVGEYFYVKVFVGNNQSKLSTDLVLAMQQMGDRAEFIQICGAGKNALDFHIAYYLGRLVENEPDAFFHIISKDKGFDPLIEHMRSSKSLVQRHVEVSQISILASCATKREPIESNLALDADYKKIFDCLKARKNKRPKKRVTLKSTVTDFFKGSLSELQVDQLIQRLVTEGIVELDGTAVKYKFNGREALS